MILLVRTGRRARRAARRGRLQPLDLDLMADLGFLPREGLYGMRLPGTVFEPAMSVHVYFDRILTCEVIIYTYIFATAFISWLTYIYNRVSFL